MKKLFLIALMLTVFSFAKAQELPGAFDYDFGDYGLVFEDHNNLSVFVTGKKFNSAPIGWQNRDIHGIQRRPIAVARHATQH